MNTDAPPDLAARFADSDGRAVSIDGHDVQPMLRLEVNPGDIIEVARLTANRQRPQAVKLALADGDLVVSSTRAHSVGLWNTTAPRRVRVRVDAPAATTLDIWNAWRFVGLDHAWIGNAGMTIQSERRRHTLQCSDGVGPVDFTDLVVTIEVLDA